MNVDAADLGLMKPPALGTFTPRISGMPNGGAAVVARTLPSLSTSRGGCTAGARVVVVGSLVVEEVEDPPLALRVVLDGATEVLVVMVISLPGRTQATGLRSTNSIETVWGK
ncbi:unannotated protein [freshwater metagenome]|uniref:Unannotated protein n=1 Tax=freshwater metagenome TaxID=449393 RepID=A0A6J6MQR4_9ZZZZ